MMRFLRLPNFRLDLDIESFDTWLRLLVAATSPRLSIDGYTYGADKARVYEIKRDGLTIVLLDVIVHNATIEIRLVRLPGVRFTEPSNITRDDTDGSTPLGFLNDEMFCWRFYLHVEELGAKFKDESERYPQGLYSQVLRECLWFDGSTDGHDGLIFTELGLADGQERTTYELAERWGEADKDRPLPCTRAKAIRAFGAERLLGMPPNTTTNTPILEDEQNGKDRSISKESKQPYGPRFDTENKIAALRRLRKDSRNFEKKEITRAWITACQLARIDPKTVKRLAPELRRHWDDWDYWDN